MGLVVTKLDCVFWTSHDQTFGFVSGWLRTVLLEKERRKFEEMC
jgi:hypothetical protein